VDVAGFVVVSVTRAAAVAGLVAVGVSVAGSHADAAAISAAASRPRRYVEVAVDDDES
jgi:hypothetical protein